MPVTVYGIPNCGTVKKARRWLDARGVAHTFVDFRAVPPARETVDGWVAAFTAKKMRNTSGGAYRALPDEKKQWSDEVWAEKFAADPMLIKRPIITGDAGPLLVGFRGSDEDLAAALGI